MRRCNASKSGRCRGALCVPKPNRTRAGLPLCQRKIVASNLKKGRTQTRRTYETRHTAAVLHIPLMKIHSISRRCSTIVIPSCSSMSMPLMSPMPPRINGSAFNTMMGVYTSTWQVGGNRWVHYIITLAFRLYGDEGEAG